MSYSFFVDPAGRWSFACCGLQRLQGRPGPNQRPGRPSRKKGRAGRRKPESTRRTPIHTCLPIPPACPHHRLARLACVRATACHAPQTSPPTPAPRLGKPGVRSPIGASHSKKSRKTRFLHFSVQSSFLIKGGQGSLRYTTYMCQSKSI